MNCVQIFSDWVKEDPKRCAIRLPDGSTRTFRELEDEGARIQARLHRLGLKPGDHVLLALELGVDLYSTVLALLASGFPVLLVEPWLPLDRIEGIISRTTPKAFITHTRGKLWGIRSKAIRSIPHWLAPSDTASADRLKVVDVPADHVGVLTFTTGTTGAPKGVIRTHGYLLEQHRALEANLHSAHPGHEDDRSNKPDWCIFTNFTLANLASGRTTILMPSVWRRRDFLAIDQLPEDLAPRSLTCGPTFLKKMLEYRLKLPHLDYIHVGGALTENDLLEAAFDAYPNALFTHVYGSAEAEPVACVDARVAVMESRNYGYLQMLCLGKPVPEIRFDASGSALWVAGKHVCPKYLDDETDNRIFKRQDADGTVWHNMGDRVRQDKGGVFWYAGRAQQPQAEFDLEQKTYMALGHSSAFIHRDRSSRLWLLGEKVTHHEKALRQEFPEIDFIEDAIIQRDARHRARIDRTATLRKSAPWLLG